MRFEADEDSEYRPSTAGTRPLSGSSGPPERRGKVIPSRPGSGVSSAVTTGSTEGSEQLDEEEVVPVASTDGQSFQAFLSKQMLKIDTGGGGPRGN